MKLELTAQYVDWDTVRGDRVMIYLDGEFVVELKPERKPDASPGDQDRVVVETLASALERAFSVREMPLGNWKEK